MPHLPLARHHPQQGDPGVVPSVHDVSIEVRVLQTCPFSIWLLIRMFLKSLQMLRADHQDWLPGRHREAVGEEGQAVSEKVPSTAAYLLGLS